MKEFKLVYSQLEKDFDNITIENCWNCTKPRDELFFLTESNVEITLQVKGKSNYIYKSGKWSNRIKPDFILLTDDELIYLNEKIRKASLWGEWKNPFDKVLRPEKRIAIELFGDYWHSEKVIGMSREKHVEQVKKAYHSIGWEVYIIWESDFKDGNIEDFIRTLLIGEEKKIVAKPNLNKNIITFMQNPDTFKILKEDEKEKVVDEVFSILRNERQILIPDYFEVIKDVNSFSKRVGDGLLSRGLTSRVGQKVCQHFCREILNAKPKARKSINELWNSDEKLKEAIYRQLEFFDGMQTINKIKNELLGEQNYRKPSNFPPLLAVKIYQEMGMKKGDVLFDPCCGYGSRLLASWVLGVDYIGVDANYKLTKELVEMGNFLNSYDKRNEVNIIHGAVEDNNILQHIKNMKKDISYAFTSPPYFDLEIYSQDEEQFSNRYKLWSDFKCGFLSGLFRNVYEILNKDGIFVLNVPKKAHSTNFSSEVKEVAVSEYWSINDEMRLNLKGRRGTISEVLMSFKKGYSTDKVVGFGIKNADKNYYMPNFIEGKEYVVCKICGERFARLNQHLTRTHKISYEQYLEQYPDSLLQAEIDSERVADENKAKNYQVKLKKDVFSGMVEGVDFVRCVYCGYKGRNIIRHVKASHDLETYPGELKCVSCKESLHKGALLKWDRQGRKPKKDKDINKNKTHKHIDGKPLKEVITKEVLVELYEKKGLSAKSIGLKYNVSENYILTALSDFKIKKSYGRTKIYKGKTLLSVLSKEFNINDRKLKNILNDNNISCEKKGILSYFDYNEAKNIIESQTKN